MASGSASAAEADPDPEAPSLDTLPLVPLARIARHLSIKDLATLSATSHAVKTMLPQLEGYAKPSLFRTLNGNGARVMSVAMNASGDRLAAVQSKGQWTEWNTSSGEVVARCTSLLRRHMDGLPAYLPSRRGPVLFYTSGRDVHMVAPREGLELGRGAGGPIATFPGHEGELNHPAAISGDETRIATLSNVGRISIWDTNANDGGVQVPLTELGPRHTAWHVALNDDGTRALTWGSDYALCVWNVIGESEPIAIPPPQDIVLSAALRGDGKLAAFATYDEITLCSAETGATVWTRPINTTVSAMAFSKSGRVLLVGLLDGTLRNFVVNGGMPRGNIQGARHGIRTLVVSRGGMYAAAATRGDSVAIWHLGSSA